ncbi:hypothetical protein Tco_0516938 [Tanacetum coccineum]
MPYCLFQLMSVKWRTFVVMQMPVNVGGETNVVSSNGWNDWRDSLRDMLYVDMLSHDKIIKMQRYGFLDNKDVAVFTVFLLLLTALCMRYRFYLSCTEKICKKNDVKARSLLLMALPNEHQLTFDQYVDAQSMFAAIKARFGGNEATKKTQKAS